MSEELGVICTHFGYQGVEGSQTVVLVRYKIIPDCGTGQV